MTQRITLLGASTSFLALATAASADVTPKDVWENMTGFYTAGGHKIEAASIDDSGDTLTVNGLNVSLATPMGDMQEEVKVNASFSIPQVVLKQASDGSVDIEMSNMYSMTVEIAPKDEKPGTIAMSVDQTGLAMAASGDPGNVTYDLSGPAIVMKFESLEVPGEEGLTEAIDATITLNNYSGTYMMGGGDKPTMDVTFAAAGGVLDFKMQEPGGGEGRFSMDVAIDAMEWDSSGVMIAGADPSDMTKMLRDGMKSTGNMTHGGAQYEIDFLDGREAFNAQGSSSSGAVNFDMSADGMSYSLSNSDMNMKLSGSDIPLPEIALSAGATLFGMTMPVLASDSAQDVGLAIKLQDFAVSEMIWGMIDPGGQLPHDPATLIVDLAGKGNWLIDILDPTAFESAGAGMPGAIEAMDLKELKVSLAGAELTGKGGFTFDMDDMATFDGIPAPTGALDLNLAGANGLMDKLTAMGLLPQEQAMGARMMMGMFAKPGGAPDTLTSKIEINGATGGISANGQRLR